MTDLCPVIKQLTTAFFWVVIPWFTRRALSPALVWMHHWVRQRGRPLRVHTRALVF